MHGILGLGTPWTRALFPAEDRAEVEALIPAGFQINVSAVNGKPGPWRVVGLRLVVGDERPVTVETRETYSPQDAVRLMAERLRGQVAA